jgi:predicted O-methyltransferase YrrM
VSALAGAAAVLDRLEREGAERDEAGKRRVRAREAELGHRVYGGERAALYGTAPIAVTREVGTLLYLLARASGGRTVVEFGASLGFSTIHLAAGARDAGAGRVVTTEFDATKAALARANLAEAGLADVVELREGDATTTLRGLGGPVGLLFLDGWNDLYVDVLELVAPVLAPGALVVADLSAGDPACDAYRAHVADGWTSVLVPLDAGVVVSARDQ